MKNCIIYLIIGTIGISHCLGQKSGYKTIKDDFLNVKIKEYREYLKSEERFSTFSNAEIYFVNNGQNVTMYTILNKYSRGFYPDLEILFKIDDMIVKLPIKGVENEFSRTAQSNSELVIVDSVLVNRETATTYNEIYYIKFKTVLTENLKGKISNAKSLSFRIYSGGRSNTFDIKDIRDLKKVLE